MCYLLQGGDDAVAVVHINAAWQIFRCLRASKRAKRRAQSHFQACY